VRNLSITPVWRLAPGVHAVAVDDDLVILDVRADAYHCLAGAGPALTRDNASVPIVSNPAVAELLSIAGLIDGQSHAKPPAAFLPPLPRASAIPATTPKPAWEDIPAAAGSVMDVVLRYRGRTFAEILQSVGAPRDDVSAGPPPAPLLALVERFHRWIPYAPVSGKCLLRSFILLRILRRSGHDARWVFGVSTWPFRAHCWLQHGDVALDDSVDYLTAFTPIMAV
jgi:hypothetical protein